MRERRRALVGTVTSDKMEKTVVVTVGTHDAPSTVWQSD